MSAFISLIPLSKGLQWGCCEGGIIVENINSLILWDRLGVHRFALYPIVSALGGSAEGLCVVIKIILHLCQVAHVNRQPTSDAQGPKGPVMDCIIRGIYGKGALSLHFSVVTVPTRTRLARRPRSAQPSVDMVSIFRQQRGEWSRAVSGGGYNHWATADKNGWRKLRVHWKALLAGKKPTENTARLPEIFLSKKKTIAHPVTVKKKQLPLERGAEQWGAIYYVFCSAPAPPEKKQVCCLACITRVTFTP